LGRHASAVGVQTGAELLQRTMVSISVSESEHAFRAFMSHPHNAALTPAGHALPVAALGLQLEELTVVQHHITIT
jgi:hypothetical protein